MHWLLLAALAAQNLPRPTPPRAPVPEASRFWEFKAPGEWSEEELQVMLANSPWARADGTRMYLASARPMREAEREFRRRHVPRNLGETLAEPDDDYHEFLKANEGRCIVVAVLPQDYNDLSDAAEMRRMEKDSYLKVGKKKFRLSGHYPPTQSDPYLRLIFPREIPPGAKKLEFELYLPGVSQPYRLAEFDLKEMTYRGKLEL